jgi:hypothetical protein
MTGSRVPAKLTRKPARSAPNALPGDETRSNLYRDAYDEGKRAVDRQIAELDSMRQRSAQFISFVGSATAFLVGTGLGATPAESRDAGYFSLTWTAATLSVASIALLMMVLLAIVWTRGKWMPNRARWDFANSSKTLVEDYATAPEVGEYSESDYYRDLALIYESKWNHNDLWLGQVRRSYTLFLIVGSLQVTVWALLVGISA